MKTLILAEYDDSGIKKTTLSTIGAAQKIGGEIAVLVVGTRAPEIAADIAKLDGVQQVFVNSAEVYDHGQAENIAALMADMGRAFTHILASATTFGKNILPRVAALLDVAQISEITAIINPETFVRPIYAGNAFATVQSKDTIKVITVRHTAFVEVSQNKDTPAAITTLTQLFDHPRAHFVSYDPTVSSRPELTSAVVIVAGGRGLQNGENFHKLLTPLAEKLNAAIGATRAAVDAHYVDNDYQVGQTGKVVAPQLYIAIGISGAIQHLAGIKDSKVIVAINKDAEAEIMKIADYALQADLFSAVPELTSKL